MRAPRTPRSSTTAQDFARRRFWTVSASTTWGRPGIVALRNWVGFRVTTKRISDERALHEQLDRIWYRNMTRSVLQGEQCAPLDAAGRVLLRATAANGQLRSSALADICLMSRPAVSRRVAVLIEAGFIEAEADPLDGRASVISVTAKGAESLERIERQGVAMLSDIVADFDETELVTLGRLLQRWNDRADTIVEPRPPRATSSSARAKAM